VAAGYRFGELSISPLRSPCGLPVVGAVAPPLEYQGRRLDCSAFQHHPQPVARPQRDETLRFNRMVGFEV
jgi:hypothetical protein